MEAELGPIWALVNNAGWDRPAPFLSTDQALWDKIIRINLYGPLNTHHVVAPLMVARRAGRIINIASDAARVGTSNEAVYSACKGGLISFTKSVARELASKGVLLNAVCPGPTNTPMMASVLGEGEQAVKWKDAMVRGIPLQSDGRAGGLRRHRRLPGVRRRRFHHRPDHFGRGRHEYDLTINQTLLPLLREKVARSAG